jgi:hypothetical protein
MSEQLKLPTTIPARPDAYTIPTALIEQSQEIRPGERLNFPLTR